VRRELLLPLALLAVGLAAAGGFFAASAVLSKGGGQKEAGTQVVLPGLEGDEEVGPPGLFRRAFAGLVLAEDPDGGGVRITEVVPGGPADEAGLEKGDVITAVDGLPVFALERIVPWPPFIPDVLANKNPGDQVTFTVRRDGQEQDVTVTLGARPGAVQAAPGPPIELPVPGMDTPYVGVRLAEVTLELQKELDLARGDGVAVIDVARGSPADEAGLRRGDVILMIGFRRVETVEEAQDAILDKEPGEAALLLVRRGVQEMQVEVEMGARPGMGTPFDLWWGQPLSRERLRSLLPGLGLDLDLTDPEGLFERLVGVDVVVLDQRGEHVKLHLTAGFLIDVSDAEIRLAPNGYSGIDRSFTVTEDTRVFGGLQEREIEDLKPGDRALVLSRDDSDDALIVFSPVLGGETGLRPFAAPVTPE